MIIFHASVLSSLSSIQETTLWCRLVEMLLFFIISKLKDSNLLFSYSGTMKYNFGSNYHVFANSAGDRGSIPCRNMAKTQKIVLNASLLNTRHYHVWIKVKWSNPEKGVALSPIPWCCSY